PLARAMCASPFDAAIHDAAGIALNRSSFDLYVDGSFPAVREMLRAPRRTLDAWLIVGPGDSLDDTFAQTVARHGYRCFKMKIGGKDNGADAQRTVDVFRAARAAGVPQPRLSIDSNEANPNADAVL